MLTFTEWRKWVIANDRFRCGVAMARLDTLYEVTLTTKEGKDNSWSKMVIDNRHLRAAMAKHGYRYVLERSH